ncbi:MAG: GNAT family N-acetyltransferase [Bacilli bacterium]|nr:GNAT family N-acetyltransferase [Bacilli bacterium]
MTKTAKAKELIQEVGDSLVIFEYENQDKISDCRKVLEILLELANQNGEKYQIKEVYNREWCNEEDRRFYENRPEKSEDNTSLIIAKKEALEELDDNKVLWFGEYMKRMLSEKYSIVITVKSHRPTNIMSDALDGNKHEFKLDYVREEKNGEFSNIGCYTFDDELNDAVNMLCEYINIYGDELVGFFELTCPDNPIELEEEYSVSNYLPNIDINNTGVAESFVVLPKYRGNNLQVEMFKRMEEIAKERGITSLIGTVHPENNVSANNFEKAGYNIVTRFKVYYGERLFEYKSVDTKYKENNESARTR